MITSIIKRDGRETVFDQTKIADAIEKAFQASGAMQDRSVAEQITDSVMEKLEEGAIEGTPTVEGVQDLVEEALIEANFSQTAKAYILYRAERNRVRDVNSRLVQTLKDITFSKASDSDMKRENANIDADTAMGTMLKYGSESAKQFIQYLTDDDRPQVKKDVDYEGGMGVSIGRLREDSIFDWKFVGLAHNTLRGAAGGALESAEMLKALGYITKK